MNPVANSQKGCSNVSPAFSGPEYRDEMSKIARAEKVGLAVRHAV
jgi:hypothetical protein